MALHNEIGKWGEDAAVRFLEELGYRVIARNWKNRGRKELDIVAIDGEDLVFVEVKTRSYNTAGSPFNAVDGRKQHRLALAANSFIVTNHISLNPRFDVIGIIGNETSFHTEHVKNAFIPSAFYY